MDYALILCLKINARTYLSIIHDNFDKSNTSMLALVNKEKYISNIMNLVLISLTSILTHGNKIGDSFMIHFSLSFLKMVSNYTMTSLGKYINNVEGSMVDHY